MYLPQKFPELGQLVAIDGSLIDSVLSMTWVDYRGGAKKAKTHIGFDINRGIPQKIFLTAGNDGERPFVSRILLPGETGVLDRGYQKHKNFDLLQSEGKKFVCRIKANTTKHAWKRSLYEKILLSSMTQRFFSASKASVRRKNHGDSSGLRLTAYDTGLPQVVSICPLSKLPS